MALEETKAPLPVAVTPVREVRGVEEDRREEQEAAEAAMQQVGAEAAVAKTFRFSAEPTSRPPCRASYKRWASWIKERAPTAMSRTGHPMRRGRSKSPAEW
jgi:hypothetical protein